MVTRKRLVKTTKPQKMMLIKATVQGHRSRPLIGRNRLAHLSWHLNQSHQGPALIDGLSEHVGLGFYQVIINGLEVQPTNVVRTHVLATVASAIRWH